MKLPERVTPNDTKFNNVMLNDVTGEGVCVINLVEPFGCVGLFGFKITKPPRVHPVLLSAMGIKKLGAAQDSWSL